MARHSERWYQAVGIPCSNCGAEANDVCRLPDGHIYNPLHQERWEGSARKPENAKEWVFPGRVND